MSTYGEEAAARFAEGLAVRIRNGEFSSGQRQTIARDRPLHVAVGLIEPSAAADIISSPYDLEPGAAITRLQFARSARLPASGPGCRSMLLRIGFVLFVLTLAASGGMLAQRTVRSEPLKSAHRRAAAACAASARRG